MRPEGVSVILCEPLSIPCAIVLAARLKKAHQQQQSQNHKRPTAVQGLANRGQMVLHGLYIGSWDWV